MNLMSCLCDGVENGCGVSPSGSLIDYAKSIGIDCAGIASVHSVPDEITVGYNQWLAQGNHGDMGYLEKYGEVRANPALLLPGAKSIVSCAIGYYHRSEVEPDALRVASYAHGDDYHDVVRGLVNRLADYVKSTYGGDTRVCVDTAPIHERYWAVECGVGYRGRSGLVIVPGLGTYCFLAELITTVGFEPTGRIESTECSGCGRCVAACPCGAINGDGTVDARKCLSYLTIEYRGEFPQGLSTGGRLYGCDTCQIVCPHNAGLAETQHSEFLMRERYKNLTVDKVIDMQHETYIELFRHSAIKRAKLPMLVRNAGRSR